MIGITKRDMDALAALLQNIGLLEGKEIDGICSSEEFARLLLLTSICENLESIAGSLNELEEILSAVRVKMITEIPSLLLAA